MEWNGFNMNHKYLSNKKYSSLCKEKKALHNRLRSINSTIEMYEHFKFISDCERSKARVKFTQCPYIGAEYFSPHGEHVINEYSTDDEYLLRCIHCNVNGVTISSSGKDSICNGVCNCNES